VISYPFTASGGSVSQPVWVDDPATGGKASYRFVITNPGDYVVDVTVDAPDVNRNSFFVNIDGEPAAPMMIWDIAITKGFEKRAASWRGQGTEDKNQFVPRVFTLAAGEHELIVRGREGETRLDRIGLEPFVPATPTPTHTTTAAPAPRGSDVTMHGKVYDALAGYSKGIAGARLTLTMCLPGNPRTWTDADGNYRLVVSGPDLDACLQTMLQVKANEYSPLSLVIAAPGLRADPHRDIAMLPKGKLLGDVNADGAVNLFDLVIVSSAYDPQAPASDPSADVNSDGQVDLFDLVEVSSNYGSTSP
jgi:hypothetical protein